MTPSSDRFAKAMEAFDAYHKKDPNTEVSGGEVFPKELLYAMRMSDRLQRFAPDAGEVAKLAARSQHIGRWEIPREKYPMDKKGYLQWRNEEKIRHAKIAEQILADCGFEAETVEEVKFLLLKKQLTTHAGTQLLEDVICLVFIEFYLEEFAARHDDEKIIDILRKTIRKMSSKAIAAVPELRLSTRIQSLVSQSAAPLS
jgi:hypothetical protein